MRVVIDTNVLISALIWHGTPHQLLAETRQGNAQLILSATLFEEISEVIHRGKFAAILQTTSRTPARLLAELHALAEFVFAPPLLTAVCRDPDDDAVLALAIAANADWIISGDSDLLVLGNFQGISIISPAEAVKRLPAA